MKKIMLLFVLLASARDSYAVVNFNWDDISASNPEKQRVVNIFQTVASRYLEEGYTDLGPLDFFTASEEYTIRWSLDLARRNSENWATTAQGSSTLSLSFDLLQNPNALETLFAHETSHFYDITMTDRLRHFSGYRMFASKYRSKISFTEVNRWVGKYLYGGEARAVNKEINYLRSMKNRMSKEEYKNLMSKLLETKRLLGK